MSETKVEIIADSMSPHGHRITTFILEYPRFIHAELLTHRLFSRNSASSRAIPSKSMIRQVKHNPFFPLKVQKDHKGMQGNDYLDKDQLIDFTRLWKKVMHYSIDTAMRMMDVGVSKQIINRILEPYQIYKVILTATEFDNFFAQRCHPAAEDRMQELAYKMRDAIDNSLPKRLEFGQWHIPFCDSFGNAKLTYSEQIKVAVSRCARISYNRIEGKTYADDVRLFHDLFDNKHRSPFEHVARCMNDEEYNSSYRFETNNYGWCNNFRGFMQLRFLVERYGNLSNIIND